MIREFKEFAMRGSMLDLAVGIIIGVAFNAMINSLVNHILMPPIGVLIGRVDFASLAIPLTPDAAISYGLFINEVVNFLIIAFVVFLIVRWANRARSKSDAATGEPTSKDCPYCLSTIPIKATRCPNCTSDLRSAQPVPREI